MLHVTLVAPMGTGIMHLSAPGLEPGRGAGERIVLVNAVGRRSPTGDAISLQGRVTVPWSNIAGVHETAESVK